MKGDAERGKQVFAKTCAACHKVQGVGHDIGPNLAAMKARGPEAILLNVLDPNREVNPQYLSYAVLTTDGRQLTGMIAAETATSVTLTPGRQRHRHGPADRHRPAQEHRPVADARGNGEADRPAGDGGFAGVFAGGGVSGELQW